MTDPLAKNGAKVTLGDRNREIQHFATDRADQALAKCVRLWNASRRLESTARPIASGVPSTSLVSTDRACSTPVFPVSRGAVAAACTVAPSAETLECRA